MNKVEVLFFNKTIAAHTEEILDHRIKEEGTIVRMYSRFYAGQVGLLRVYPYVEHTGERIERLISPVYSGKEYLAGDDDEFDIPLVIPVDVDDAVKVKVQNLADYDYDLVFYVVVDYYAGKRRVVGGVL